MHTATSVVVTPSRADPVVGRVRSFIALTKPRIIELLLVTTIPTMLMAEHTHLPPAGLVLATLCGGMLAAGGANALNMVIDRDIDTVMHRTRNRPLVTGAMSAGAATAFALALELIAFVELATLVNLLSALLALSATAFYIGIYTLWLKRTSTQNIVVGGAAGAVPVLVGWTAVTGHLAVAPLVLFAIIFTWTPPHFWALAVRYRDDYNAAGVPMLPAVATMATTTRWIVAYTVVTVALSLALAPIGHLGLLYLLVALGAGGAFVAAAMMLQRRPTPAAAMRLFGISITYLTVLSAGIALDQLLAKA